MPLQALAEDAQERPDLEVVEALLGKRLKVATNTGRHFTGTLTFLDHLGNVLLFDTVEHCTIGEFEEERSLGQVLIPLRIIKQAQVQVLADDKVLRILLQDVSALTV